MEAKKQKYKSRITKNQDNVDPGNIINNIKKEVKTGVISKLHWDSD